MNKLPAYLILLTVAASCGDSNFVPVEDEYKYCANKMKLITAQDDFILLEKELLLEQHLIKKLDSIIGNEFCDIRVNLGFPFDMESKSFNLSPKTIPLKIKFNKVCSSMGHSCGRYNYMEVLYNMNYQILFEGDFIQMEEIKKRVPQFFANIDSNYHEEPRRLFMTIQWSSGLELDSLSSLFGNIIDGYFETISQYSLRRFNSTVCDLSNSQMDTLEREFPFNLLLPSFGLDVPLPPPLPPIKTDEFDILEN